MKSIQFLFIIAVLFITNSSFKSNNTVVQSREFYQLKTYIFNSKKQQETTEKYLKNAYLPALKKLGIKNIGVFKPRPNLSDTIRKCLVLIPFSNIKQFLTLNEKLSKDSEYLAAGADYLKATYLQAPYNRIESVLLKAFEDHPFLKTPDLNSARENRVYELRSYESATEAIHKSKVDMFNAGQEIKLFESLKANAVFYGEVISGAKMPNLMYMTTYSDQVDRDAHWKAFSASAEWKAMSSLPKYLNTVSHMDIQFLYPTDYSDY